MLKIFIKCEFVFLLVTHHSCLLIFSNPLLKEVGLPFQGNIFHEVKWVFDIVNLLKSRINSKIDGCVTHIVI